MATGNQRPLTKAERERQQQAREAYTQRTRKTLQLDADVKLTLKGKEYTLEFNNWAVKEILKDTGWNILSEGFTLERRNDPIVLGSMFFRALQTNHPDLTQDDADRLFTSRHYPAIADALVEALDFYLPNMDDFMPPDEPPEPDEDPSKPSTDNGSATGRLDGSST